MRLQGATRTVPGVLMSTLVSTLAKSMTMRTSPSAPSWPVTSVKLWISATRPALVEIELTCAASPKV